MTETLYCKHCGDELMPAYNEHVEWGPHASTHLWRCQDPNIAYGHLAEPVGTPCRADGPNPCLGADEELAQARSENER